MSSISPVNTNPYIPASADNGAPTDREKNETFKSDLREDATELTKVEVEGDRKLALVDSALGSLVDIRA